MLVALGLFGFLGAALLWPDAIAAHAAQHFRSLEHRVHDLTFAFLFGTAGVGLLAQLWKPSKNVAGQLMALIPWIALVLVFPLTSFWRAPGAGFVIVATATFGALTLLATILHPAAPDVVRSLDVSRVNRVMIALVVVAAVPLLAFAAINIGLQRTVTNAHAALGHYGFMAAFGFTVIGVGLLASLRPVGWWLPTWVAGFLPALLGLASLVYPDVDSSLSRTWTFVAIAWGVAFVAAARLTQHRETAMPPAPQMAGSKPTTSKPRGLKLFAIIFTVLLLLFVILHVTGRGPGGH